jgi:hypothetical protein
VRSEPGLQRREQRAVRADAREDRLRRAIAVVARRPPGGFGEDDADGLPPAVLDQDRLTDLEVLERWRDVIRVEPPAGDAGGVDGDLDGTPGAVRPRPGRVAQELRRGCVVSDGARAPAG